MTKNNELPMQMKSVLETINTVAPTVEDQIKWEEFFRTFAKERLKNSLQQAAADSRIFETKTCSGIIAKAVIDVADEIIAEIKESKTRRGATPKHFDIIEEIGVEESVLVVASELITICVSAKEPLKYTATLFNISDALEVEYYGVQCSTMFPEETTKALKQLRNNKSKSLRHRKGVFQNILRGVEIDFNKSMKLQVVNYIVTKLCNTIDDVNSHDEVQHGSHMFTSYNLNSNERLEKYIVVTPEITTLLVEENDELKSASMSMPTLIKPLQWTSMFCGGFYGEMTDEAPSLVKSSYTQLQQRERLGSDDSQVMQAVNTIQSQAWQINPAVYNFLSECKEKGIEIKGVVETKSAWHKANPAPKRYAFFDKTAKEDMTPAQLQKLLNWKKEMVEYRRSEREVNTNEIAFCSKMGIYDILKELNQFYVVYNVDYRGRIYACGGSINPQGSDLDKYILRASVGAKMTLGDHNAWCEFKMAAAGKYGVDKLSPRERVQWFNTHFDEIVATGNDPFANLDFLLKSEHVVSFYAFCEEFARFVANPDDFETKLPCPLDGTCSGLQHISAVMRDAEAGKKVNLCSNGLDDAPEDIYKFALAKTQLLLEYIAKDSSDKEKQKLAKTWLNRDVFGRNLTKKTTMTLSYNCTFSACRDNVSSYLKQFKAIAKNKNFYVESNFLAEVVWAALHGSKEYGIEGAVQRGLELLEFWKTCTSTVMKYQNKTEQDYKAMSFVAPTGFRVVQVAQKKQSIKVETKINRRITMTYRENTPKANVVSHVNKIVANGIHSLDASHLVMTCNKFTTENDVFQSYIHDSFATLAPNVGKMRVCLQESYVELYSTDRRDMVGSEYRDIVKLPECPEFGSYCINEVLDSVNFFS